MSPPPPRTPPLLEIAVDTLDDALAAAAAGADRLELCTDLASHGLSAGRALLVAVKRQTSTPVAAMVRPRAGDFLAPPDVAAAARRDAASLAGADALVFGFLTPDRHIDVPLTRDLVGIASATGQHTQTVFHRAFDLVPDPLDALDLLASLGVTRVLTSGMSPAAAAHAMALGPPPPVPDALDARLDRLRRLIDHARGRIEIIPCGTVRASNAKRFITATGATQLHSACRENGTARLDRPQLAALVATLMSV